MAVSIRTDHKWKPFVYGADVPGHVLKKQFDYVDDAEQNDGFFKYLDYWYHISDFVAITDTLRDAGFDKNWDGYASDSYFSGICIKISKDGESYKVGTYIS
jgi:hypothetical protein